MKKKFFMCISLLMTVLIISFSSLIPEAASTDNVKTENKPEITLMSKSKDFPDEQKILETRFLNMLNHNFVYNNTFNTVEDVVNNSIVALLNLCDSENDSFIAQNYVNGYIYNMYGIAPPDYSAINVDYPKRDGFVYIVPRGYSVYSHVIESVNYNDDGSYTVVTSVEISSHDRNTLICKAETLFVKNDNSAFGYNIISSDLIDSVSTL